MSLLSYLPQCVTVAMQIEAHFVGVYCLGGREWILGDIKILTTYDRLSTPHFGGGGENRSFFLAGGECVLLLYVGLFAFSTRVGGRTGAGGQ